MADYCIVCETELGCTDPTGWTQRKDGELVCPWCIKDMINSNETIETFHGVWKKQELQGRKSC